VIRTARCFVTLERVLGRLAVHGYTPKDGLPIDQLTEYLPDLRRDQLIVGVHELAHGCVRTLLGRSGQAEVVIPTERFSEALG
jgi:hypothetical protein